MRGNNWRGLQNFVKLCLVIKFFYTSTGHALYWMKLIVYWGTFVFGHFFDIREPRRFAIAIDDYESINLRI